MRNKKRNFNSYIHNLLSSSNCGKLFFFLIIKLLKIGGTHSNGELFFWNLLLCAFLFTHFSLIVINVSLVA